MEISGSGGGSGKGIESALKLGASSLDCQKQGPDILQEMYDLASKLNQHEFPLIHFNIPGSGSIDLDVLSPTDNQSEAEKKTSAEMIQPFCDDSTVVTVEELENVPKTPQ